MQMCKDCFLQEHPEEADEPFNEWEKAPKSYGECDICRQRTRVADL